MTKANDARLLKGTINRMMRRQLASGWNKWVDSYHAERLAAGLSAQLDAHGEALQAQELHATAKLEEALAAHEVDNTRCAVPYHSLMKCDSPMQSDSAVISPRLGLPHCVPKLHHVVV